ncbi:MAG: FliA/WhiG family RNA polymerase sigma factor [Oscillospiraceae bacterium]|nr:FliA/WhiG family RNA polymerase sigma factor [Oscillospiraceae bacterium]
MNNEKYDELWRRYKTDNDQSAREELIVNYSHIVQAIVRRMMPKYNSFNEFEDLINTGLIGLIKAVERFEPERGFVFETYATTRIRGEILDYMREQDWASISLRKRINSVITASENLSEKYQRPADDNEIATYLNLTVEQVREATRQSHIFNIIGFEDMVNEQGIAIEAAADTELSPENTLLNKEFLQRLTELIEELPERERLIITLYYYEGLMIKDIAAILNITDGRVSQIHSKVLEKLKNQLAD